MSSITTTGHFAAALAFFALALLLLTAWRARDHSRALAIACALSAAWSAILGAEAGPTPTFSVLADCFEIIRNGAWTIVLTVQIGQYRVAGSRWPLQLRRGVGLVALFYVAYLLATAIGLIQIEAVNTIGLMPSVGARVGLAVYGMLLVEQLYRNMPESERWISKFACLGIGGMYVYDFYMYSDAMLFHALNPAIWGARGVVYALTVPMIALSVARSAERTRALAVSRRVMFHSAALFGSAGYLLLMGSAGYYLRYFGGSWGSVMQVVFLFGAGVLLIGILFSGTFRAWLKVFISKNFYRYNYDYREEWLRFTRTLSQPGPGLAARTIEAVGALVESPAGLLWTRHENGSFAPVANWLMAPSTATIEADAPLCTFLTTSQWVIDLEQYRAEPDKYDNIVLPACLLELPRVWLVVPLMMQDELYGFMVLQESRSAISLNWEVIDLLKIAGRQAASYLSQYDAANALMVARQFESFNRMSTFVVHDLKNLVSQLSLLMSNAERHKDNPEFQRDMFETVDYSVQKMKLMLQKLSRSIDAEQAGALSLERVLRQAVALKEAFEPRPSLKISSPNLIVLADDERLERVVGHLIQNSIEATSRNGRVEVELLRRGDEALICITDTGEGMTEAFIRERLFKPFETTKSAGMGIGVFESQEYIAELGGTLNVDSVPGKGSTFCIVLPLLKPDARTLQQVA